MIKNKNEIIGILLKIRAQQNKRKGTSNDGE